MRKRFSFKDYQERKMDVRIFKVEVNLCGDISRYYVKFSLEDNEKFEDLKEKIVSRVSGLSDKEFKILWIDPDGDEISMVTSDDFTFFLENNVKRIYVRCEVPALPDTRKRGLPLNKRQNKRTRLSDSNSDIHLIDSEDSTSSSSSVCSVQLDSEDGDAGPSNSTNTNSEAISSPPSTSNQPNPSETFDVALNKIQNLVGTTLRRLSDPILKK